MSYYEDRHQCQDVAAFMMAASLLYSQLGTALSTSRPNGQGQIYHARMPLFPQLVISEGTQGRGGRMRRVSGEQQDPKAAQGAWGEGAARCRKAAPGGRSRPGHTAPSNPPKKHERRCSGSRLTGPCADWGPAQNQRSGDLAEGRMNGPGVAGHGRGMAGAWPGRTDQDTTKTAGIAGMQITATFLKK